MSVASRTDSSTTLSHARRVTRLAWAPGWAVDCATPPAAATGGGGAVRAFARRSRVHATNPAGLVWSRLHSRVHDVTELRKSDARRERMEVGTHLGVPTTWSWVFGEGGLSGHFRRGVALPHVQPSSNSWSRAACSKLRRHFQDRALLQHTGRTYTCTVSLVQVQVRGAKLNYTRIVHLVVHDPNDELDLKANLLE